MPRRKAATIVESSSDESAPGTERKRVTRASTSSTTRSTRQSTRNEPSISEKSVASNVVVAVRSSKRKAAEEEPKSSVLSVEISEKAKRDTPKHSNKAAPVSSTVKTEAIKSSSKKDLGKNNTNNDSRAKSTGKKNGQKRSSGKRKVDAIGTEDLWLYPNLLDTTNTVNNSTSMDVDQSHGYFLQYIIRAHSRNTHDGQDEVDNDTWAVAFQPTLPVSRSYDQSHRLGDDGSEKELEDEEINESDHDSDEDSEDSRARKRSRRIAKEESRRKKSSTIVATCGGNTVCLIDCSLGRVMAKYSHVPEEEFMCLAWTTLDHDDDGNDGAESKKEAQAEERHEQSNILAAAGASSDGTARLWDIGSLTNFENEACCLARFVGLDSSSVTAIGVSEKYLIVGTEKGLMAQYNLVELTKEIKAGRKSTYSAKPEKIYPPSPEWHESAVDEIIYIPYFSEESYASKKSTAESAKKRSPKASEKGANRGKPRGGNRRGRGHSNGVKEGAEDEDEVDGSDTEDTYEGEFVFASRESCQGEILVWEATESTESDAKLETILEWPIAESWTKFTLGENMTKTNTPAPGEGKLQQKRQNVLVAGSTDGEIIMFDLGRKPERARDGNIIAEKPSNIISHLESNELLRDVAVSQDLSTIVAGDWGNHVYIWSYHENPAHS
ncbi:Leucine-rich repeats and WD repeat domain-containing protein 1 [Entomortierella chlamydospora]|nr:Leucine-rich repeats and WD repeat domain-containing protein 1 [Entomortierella chlamydospora]